MLCPSPTTSCAVCACWGFAKWCRSAAGMPRLELHGQCRTKGLCCCRPHAGQGTPVLHTALGCSIPGPVSDSMLFPPHAGQGAAVLHAGSQGPPRAAGRRKAVHQRTQAGVVDACLCRACTCLAGRRAALLGGSVAAAGPSCAPKPAASSLPSGLISAAAFDARCRRRKDAPESRVIVFPEDRCAYVLGVLRSITA